MQNWTSLPPPLPGGPGVLPEMTGRRLAHLSIRLRFEQRAGWLPHCSRDTLGSKHPCSLFILLQVRATVEEVPGVEGSLQLSLPDQLPPNELRLDDPEIPGSDPESEACERQVGHHMQFYEQAPKPPEKEDLACSPGSWTPPSLSWCRVSTQDASSLWLATLLMAMLNPVSSPNTILRFFP